MSKTTNKYGKPKFEARISIEVKPEVPAHVLYQWEVLDEAARKRYGKQYDALTERQKTTLHFAINEQQVETEVRG